MQFTLFWFDGRTELVEGNTIVEAFNNAGYGGGELRGLDFYDDGDARDKWVFINGEWKTKKQASVELPSMPEPGTEAYERMVDFMRADLESGMGYSKVIETAKKIVEERGGDFYKEFEKWKEEKKK